MSEKVLGLDIRSNAVSAVLVLNSSKGKSIVAYEHVEIDVEKEPEDGVSHAMEQIFEKIDPVGSTCIVSLPPDKVSYRNIRVPFRAEKKINQILSFEVESTLPSAIEDMLIDYHIVNEFDETDDADIIVAVINRFKIEFYLNILSLSNVYPEVVTIGGYCLAYFLTDFYDLPESWLLVNTDACNCTVFFVVNRRIFLIRSFPVSSQIPLRAEAVSSGIEHVLLSLDEMFNLDCFPEKIFFSGCKIEDDKFWHTIEENTNISVQPVNLIKKNNIFDIDTFLKQLDLNELDLNELDSALALTFVKPDRFRGINFQKTALSIKSFFIEHKNRLIKTAVFACVVLLSALINIMIETKNLSAKVDNLDNQIKEIFTQTFPDVKRIVDPVQQMKVKIKAAKQNSFLYGKSEKNISAIEILNEISKQISDKLDIDFQRFVIGKDNVLITGNTSTFNNVDDIKNRLDKVEFFKKVTINSANINRSGNSIHFKLKIQL